MKRSASTRAKVSTLMPAGLLVVVLAAGCTSKTTVAPIVHDADNKVVIMADGNKNLLLRLNYDRKCTVDNVIVKGKEVISSNGIFSGIKVSGAWHTTHSGIGTPNVKTAGNTVTVTDINFGGGGINVTETWRFTVNTDSIGWSIDRVYHSEGAIDDTYFPGWDFNNISTWTGALLGNGGVAWCKFFDSANATYGAHIGRLTFWNKDDDACLRILPNSPSGHNVAVRFSRQPDDILTLSYYVTENELVTKHDKRRYLSDRQDVWSPFKVSAAKVSVEYTLYGLDYDEEYDRGILAYFDGKLVGELLNTIARVGVIDTNLMGSNNWHTGYAVLQEQWVAQMGLAIDDQNYFDAYKNTLDYYRDNAVGPDGRVKPRWTYCDWDAMAGTYDSSGFYECKWGYMLDSQPDFVINIAELYDFNGDLEWVRTHKSRCEQALDYMLGRDSDGDYLVEMMTDYHTEEKGSGWYDVIWASYESAFVNAEMHYALRLWADVEEQLGDNTRAESYRDFANNLKASFNKTTGNGGFWDTNNQWYIHWRDKDDSIHGNNLATAVNFMAIAYGICDDAERRNAILSHIEIQMQKENLFCWPICIYPYTEGEGHPSVNFPFPKYENGDIFLAWGQLGTQAYAEYDPAIPIKYIKRVLEKYELDGLAFQRYLRKSQTGAGNDILANNCSPIVGLYRDIYGIQPKYNRLYLEPHLTADLNGTQLKYWLRNQLYIIDLNYDDYAITVNNFKLRQKTAFAVNSAANTNVFEYFNGNKRTPTMTITKSVNELFEIYIDTWTTVGACYKKWTESCNNAGATTEHTITDLEPNTAYTVLNNGKLFGSVRSDSSGCIKFNYTGGYVVPQTFEIK